MPLDLIGDSIESFYEFGNGNCPAKAEDDDEEQVKNDDDEDASRKRREDDEDDVNDDDDDDDVNDEDEEDEAPAEPESIGDVLDATFEDWLKNEKVRISSIIIKKTF